MPFTPYHMGPGILMKAMLQGGFSLMVFGWAQIVMDLQPLIVIITGEGHLHGFTHTFVGATLIGAFSAVTGKYLSEFGLSLLFGKDYRDGKIAWWVAVVSGFIGSYSHVVLDALIHWDLEPFFPFSAINPLLGVLSSQVVHQLCIYSALVGAVLYFSVNVALSRRRK